MSPIEELLARTAVIAVVQIERLEDAVPLATALRDGGLCVIEVTLRTPVAAAAICRIGEALPELAVGAGTVTSRREIAVAQGAGARFLVSPGATDRLLDALADCALPILPGASTASKVLNLLERRIRVAKFFPAQAAGLDTLSALRGPFPQMRFCATGGIGAEQAARFHALPNCQWVGGSWMAPGEAIRRRTWGDVEQLARDAASLRHVLLSGDHRSSVNARSSSQSRNTNAWSLTTLAHTLGWRDSAGSHGHRRRRSLT